MTKKIIISSVLFFAISFVFYGNASASNLLLNENFDDQSIASGIVVYGRNWAVLSPPQYNLTSVGRGDTGHCFSSGTIGEAHPIWMNNLPSPWPSDELYVSFWLRYPTFTPSYNTAGAEFDNIKVFYPHWNGATGYVHYSMTDTHTMIYSAHASDGTIIDQSKYIQAPGMTDGKWHHYEFYINFATSKSRFWYDGTLAFDATYAPGVWASHNVYYVTTSKEDASDPQVFSRQFDDWTVWDGMPSGSTTPPATCTSFTYSAFGTCQSNNTQSRTVTSSSPAGCTGGSPVLTQSCTYTLPTCTESWTCSAWSAWSACANNSQSHTRTCTDANNCGTTTTKPATTGSQSCTQVITYNLTNFTQLVTDWLKTIASSPADVNKDGKVNSQDLGIMMSSWGQ